MSYSVSLSPGGDITALVDQQSIKRTSRLYSALKPNANKCDFRALFSPTLNVNLLNYEDIDVRIQKDGVDFFTGVISPNYSTTIQAGQKYISLTAEDYSIVKLGATIADSLHYMAFAVCDPANPTASLVHVLCSLSGVTLAAGCPTINTIVPYLIILPDDKKTYADILSELLYEYNYCYRFDASGNLVLDVAVNLGTITPALTFDATASGGNVRGSYEIKKTREQYDDIRVKYDSVQLKSGIVLFEDTSNASGSLSANIELKPTGDSGEADYYPSGAKDGEVFSEWKNPDGYTVVAAVNAALDSTIGGGIVLDRALTNYFRRASFAYRNTSAISSYITKLRIIGDAYIKTAQNTARSSVTSGKRLLEATANYIFSTAIAQALAAQLNNYYKHSCFTYTLKSQQDTDLGAYVSLVDSLYAGITQKCRVVSRIDDSSTKSITYELESVADFENITIKTESTALGGATSTSTQLAAMADDGIISPQEKNSVKVNWIAIDGDQFSTGSYWATRQAAIAKGAPIESLDLARNVLNAQLFSFPGVLLPLTWERNVPISKDFFDAWGAYYRAEAAEIALINAYSKYLVMDSIDCGTIDGSEPIETLSLEFGLYATPGQYPDNAIDYGLFDGSSPSPDSVTDYGTYSAINPDRADDCGEVQAPSSAFVQPNMVIDCGVVTN